MGTTSFALGIATGVAKIHSDKAIVIISLESSKELIASRISAAASQTNIYVDDTLDSVNDMQSALGEINNLGLVIIDYIELIAGFDSDGVRISETLREMARSLAVPVIAVAKLPRSVDTREDKRPRGSDICKLDPKSKFYDTVLCLYRESYYNSQSKQPYLAECIIAKNHRSEIGAVYLNWDAKTAKFSSLTADF
jgi:replicative DNA helicase